MSIPILQACKKRKCKPKLFGLHTFGDPGCPITTSGPFRDNICLFLRECAVLEENTLVGMPVWCTLLMHEKKSFVVPLYTVEENAEQLCRSFCDDCRSAGWGKRYVSKRSYHIIVPMDTAWNKPLDHNALELSNHLLHGLIHGNGYGHLICVNGIEGGSRYLSGREIMDLWDRICTILQARKITVEDFSKKRSMDLPLLYGTAYGHTWFGRWGYRFLRGSFGVNEEKYQKAIESLSSLELGKIVRDFWGRNDSKEIKTIIEHYSDMSETNLITLRDLLRFMLTVKKSHCPLQKQNSSYSKWKTTPSRGTTKVKTARYKKLSTAISEMDKRWPTRRLEQAAEVVVNALLDKKARNRSGQIGMTRQEVRDVARLQIGDTGLLDNVLKSLNNVVVGNHMVHRSVNPVTRILEYSVHDLGGGAVLPRIITASKAEVSDDANDVYSDLLFIYTNVLLNYPDPDSISKAVQAVLDSKLFMKEWPFRDEEEQVLTFFCNLLPRNLEDEDRRGHGEIVALPLHSTVMDLKKAAEDVFKNTYCGLENLVVTGIEGLEAFHDREVLFGVVESGVVVWVRGSGINGEGGEEECGDEEEEENWKVKCGCGAEDDDGERMVSCDMCEVWQHTRCVGIEDKDSVPPLFVCSGCCGNVVNTRSKDIAVDCDSYEFENYGCFLLLPPEMEYQFASTMELEY